MVTDLPCIVSGNIFAVLDPHKIHINCKDEDGVPLTGAEMTVAELCSSSSLLSCYNGLFGFEVPLDDDNYPGTIFRFPLRTPYANSKLSETTYSSEKVFQNLFCSLKEEATMLLLFLKSITSISLYNYDQVTGKSKLLLDISVDSGRIPQVEVERKRCIKLAREWQARRNTVICLYSLPVNIIDTFNGVPFTTKSFHLVLNSIGSSDEEINAKAEQLKVIPWVGIAAPCSFPCVVENCEISVCGNEINLENVLASLSRIDWQYIDPVGSGYAFCFLPLPNPTGLPVSINGYFSIADNRHSIKWPTHDEHGKGADFNKELVMKMVSYAYAVMITCRCQLVSYVNTPSYLSTQLSDAYSIWPLMSQVRNHPIWSCLVDPVVKLLIGQKVVWTAAGGGKWVKFSDAYYQPEGSNIPNAVINVLLEIGASFVVLPATVLDSIRAVHDLPAIIKSREMTPDLLRRSLRQFSFVPSTMLHQAKCIEILTYIFSDFSDYLNPDSFLGINIIPLMDEAASPKRLSKNFNAEKLYILENNECASFLPGISSHIIANNLPDEIIFKLKQFSQIPNINVKLAGDGVVCKELLPLSLGQWQVRLNEQFTWNPGRGNHPPLKWIFNLWKWLSHVDLNLIQKFAVIPQEKLSSYTDMVKTVNLLSLSKCRSSSLSLGVGATGMDSKVIDLLKALGVIIIAKSTGVFQNSGLYDYLLDVTPKTVITLLTNNRGNFNIGSIQWWTTNDKQILFQYLSSTGDTSMLSSAEVKLVKDLPIFKVGIGKQKYATLYNRNYFIVQQSFGLRIDAVNVVYPDNVFYCTVEETNFMRTLGCIELTYYDYCVNYFLPFCTKQNAKQKVKNYQWILSCELLWCNNLTRYLQNIALVTTASTQRMVKASDLYDPKEPAISQLFSGCEDELPSHEYQQFLPQLRRLGLTTWTMITGNGEKYEQLLINRAQSVSMVLHRNGMEFAMKRSLVVVTYLIDYFTKYCPSYVFKSSIKSTKFLFCASEPTPAYPTGLQWGGLNRSNNVFYPSELYLSENSLLVGGTGKILSRKYLNFTSYEQFQDLFNVPYMTPVIDQLNLLIACKPTITFPTSVYAIYDYFNNNLDEFKMYRSRLDSKWIWVDNQSCFEDVSKFAMHPFAGKQLEPFCYAIVQSPQLLKYEQIFSAYGIPEVFPGDMMLNVITQLQQYTSQLSSGYLDVVISILDWVHEINRESAEVPANILIPTDGCELLPPNKCIFDDRGWSQDSHRYKKSVSGYSFTHRRLPLDTATFFGVKLLSQHLLPSVNLKLQHSLIGPHQSITGRIKEAVEDYDQDIDVFKEMIQNAEDAGASEIKFVIDRRNHPTEYLITTEMEAWQGPALLVYNNAMFSDEDFTNICEIAGASKKSDPTKIGRFGVGFCSVYHITDVPSFISRNFYTIFDPNLLYLKERVTSANPGMQIDFKSSTTENLNEFKDQFIPFCGLFQCDIFGETKKFNGTIFRFPFRTEQTARKSKISQEVYLKERIDKLVKAFCNQSSEMLIFLHNINSISLYEIKQENAMECLLHVEREQVQPGVSVPLVQMFKSKPQNVSVLSNCRVKKFVIKSNKFEDHWMITSYLGGGKSLEIAQSFEGRQKGLCPLGEVAVKLDCVLLSPCKSIGSLFCFMPVPIKSNFHFLINGYFDISRDRRSLRKDEHGNLTEWNSSLIQDTIGKCFLQMLLHLDLTKGMQADTTECLEAYYSIWPQKVDEQGSDYNQVIYNSIKKVLLETDDELLWSYGQWVCPKIAYVYFTASVLPDDCKSEIISLLLKYGYPMVDIPYHVRDLLSPKIITYEMFCTDVLFKYLGEIDSVVRDNQVIRLLTHCTDKNGWEFKLITTNKCIPTKPNETLKKPNDLVDPKCSLAELYSENDECFPLDTFCELNNVFYFLKNCGMTSDHLSTEQLKERASTISRLPYDKALDRSQKLVKYITSNFSKYSSSVINEELKDIQFLSVMKCPKDITLPWYNTANVFESPGKMYSKQYKNLLFTQEPIHNSFDYYDDILEILQQNKVPILAQVLEHFKCLIHHWQNNKVNNEATNKLIGESCKATYEYLQASNVVAKHKQHEAELQQLKYAIGDLPFIWQNDMFLSAENVVLKWNYVPYGDLLCDLSRDAESKRFENLFRLLGINESPTLSQCMSILKKLHDETDGTPLTSDAIEFCSGISQHLAYHLSIDNIIKENQDSELLQQLYLPDESCFMRHFKHLVYKESIEHSSLDKSHLLKSHFKEGTYWLHQHFSAYIAKCLGIPSALESILFKITDDSFLHGSEYGQHEDLCDRINSLLDKYPNDATMFKEFIQNAEDAGASEIAFIIDQRKFPAENGELFSDSENWSRLHKLPSLLIYNNKKMTEDDLIGITKLGLGNKRDSLESIGRFGVGFNVAYHITDCPMFVSYGPGGVPENFCILDPTCQYAPHATKASPGKRWKLNNQAYVEQFYKQLLPMDIRKFHDFKQFSNECMVELNNNENGCVVFRLALTKSGSLTPSVSKISPESTMSIQSLRALFKTLAKDAHKLPLFINNLKYISGFEISEDGKCSHYFTTTVSMSKESTACKKEFSNNVKAICKQKSMKEELKFVPCSALYKKCIKTTITPKCIDTRKIKNKNSVIKEEWLLSEQFGSSELPEETMETGFSANLTPLGGIAVLLGTTEKSNYLQKYNIFCSLPLPLESHLPFHVNGHFWVDDSRKHLETGAADFLLSKWNKCLTTTVISSSYLAAIIECRKYIDFNDHCNTYWYYSLFPYNCGLNKDSKLHSFELIKHTYASMIASNCTVLLKRNVDESAKKKIEWLSILEAYFLSDKYTYESTDHESDEKLCNVILAFKLNLTNAPIEIYYHIENNKLDCPILITPEYLINVLKSVTDISHFEDIIKSNINILLNYCLLVSEEYDNKITAEKNSSDKEEDAHKSENEPSKNEIMTELFTSVPLLLTHDGCLRKFNPNKPVYRHEYAKFFPHRSEDFIDQRLKKYERGLLKECGFIQMPTINYLAQHTTVPNSTEPVQLCNVPGIENFWTCLNHIASNLLFGEIILQQLFITFQYKPIILGSDDMLYPVCKAKMVLQNLGYGISPALSVMIQLGYPTLNTDHKAAVLCISLLSSLVASPEKGDDVVECIYLHKKSFLHFNTSCLSNSEEDLTTFISTLSSSSLVKRHNYDHVDAVCKLPIFKTFDKKLQALQQNRILLPNEYKMIPTGGLETVVHHSNKQILIPEGIYSQIYKCLNLTPPSLEEFYINFVFDHIVHMNKEDIFKHIDLLRSRHCITEYTPISNALQNVPFIEFKTASEYYDPEIEVFRTFLPSDAFPPSPWNTNTWLPVLRILGLQKLVTGVKLVEFAKDVENISCIQGELMCAIQKAKVLLCAIGERMCNKKHPEPLYFCEELSIIKFIPVFINRKLKDLLQIFTKENIDEYFKHKFISFHQSIIPHHQGVNYHQISFTTNAVIDWSLDNLQCSKSDQDDIAQILHMNVQPSCATVVDNLLILSKLVTSTSIQSARNFHQRNSHVDDLQNLFNAHYQFLENHCSYNSNDMLRLQNERFIFVCKEESNKTFSMVQCNRIVKFMTIQEDLSPYLFKMPNYFSRYIGLIKLFNIQEKPTSSHFAEILVTLYLEFSQSGLFLKNSHLCLSIAEVAFTQLIKMLNDEDVVSEQQVYYLLDEDDGLYHQSELVYNDAPWYRSRLKDRHFHFMKQPMQEKKGRFSIPKCLEVPLLSSLIMEETPNDIFVEDNECMRERLVRQSPEQGNGCEYVASLKSIIKSPQFKTGLRRIIHHQTGNAPNQKDEATISKVNDLEFKCYHNIETVLKDKMTGLLIDNSKKSVCCVIHSDTIMCIAPHTPDLDEVVNTISLKLNNYLNNTVHNGLHILQMIKSSKPENINKQLDQLHIEQYNEGMRSFTVVGDLLKKEPEHSDQVVVENFCTKEQVIYWNSDSDGILATIKSVSLGQDDDITSVTLMVNENKDTEVTTLFCISKLLHPSQIQSLNLEGQQRERTVPSDLLLYNIPHESEDEAVAWVTSIVEYCNNLPPQQHCFVLERLKFYAHYYLVICNQSQPIYESIIHILDSAIYRIKELLQHLDDSLQVDDHGMSQGLPIELTDNAFSRSRSSFIRPRGTTHGYYRGPSGAYRLNPHVGTRLSQWGPPTVVEERPQVNFHEAQIWYHQASADYQACKRLIEYTTASNMPGGFKCQNCDLVCFLSHEIVDLCLKALCHAFVGLSGDLRNATNILIFYKELIKSSQCPTLDIEWCVHQVSEYDISTRFPDAHVPSEPPCCVYDETNAYNAFIAAQKVFKSVGEMLSSADSQEVMTFPLIPIKKGNCIKYS